MMGVLVVGMIVVVVVVAVNGLLLASLVNSRALGNTVIVALPHDVCIRREGK